MQRRRFLVSMGGMVAMGEEGIDRIRQTLTNGVIDEQRSLAHDSQNDIIIERGHYEPYAGSKVAMRVIGPDDEVEGYNWRITHEPSEDAGELLHDSGEHTTLTTREEGPYRVEVEAIFDDGSTMTAFSWVRGKERIIEELDEEVMDLAEQYAPILHFHPREDFFPTRYEAYVENSSLNIDRERLETNPTLLDLASGGEYSILTTGTFDVERLTDLQDSYPETVYTSVHPGVTVPYDDEEYVAIGYWIFYIHDPKPSDIGRLPMMLTEHTGDQEPVFVLFDKSGPQWVAAQQHFGGEIRPWEQVPKTDDHIHIYPAEGAHSNFFEPYAGMASGERIGTPSENYTAQHLYQEQYLPADETIGISDADDTSTGIHQEVYELTWYVDPIGKDNDEIWSYEEGDYEIILLTEKMAWAAYEGSVYHYALPGESAHRGEIPMQQARWDDLRNWIQNDIADSHEQFDASIYDPRDPSISRIVVEEDTPADFEPELFGSGTDINAELGLGNTGPQPGEFAVSVTAEHESGTEHTVEHYIFLDSGDVVDGGIIADFILENEGESVEDEVENLVIVPEELTESHLQWNRYVPLFPSTVNDIEPGNWTVTVELASYTKDIRTEDDIHDELVFEFEHEEGIDARIEFDEVTDGEVSPSDVVEATALVSRENTGDGEHTFFVGYGAVGPEGEPHDNDGTTGTTVTLQPGDSAEVDDLEWIVEEDAPEGWYDLGTALWLEADRDELQTRLDEDEREEAIEVIGTDVGYLHVESDPVAASVEINGDVVGETPLIVRLEAGTYDLLVDAADHQPEELTATVTAGETENISVELEFGPVEPPDAALRVESDEATVGEEILLDASESEDPNDLELVYYWNVTDDDDFDEVTDDPMIEWRFEESGEHTVSVLVDNGIEADTAEETIDIETDDDSDEDEQEDENDEEEEPDGLVVEFLTCTEVAIPADHGYEDVYFDVSVFDEDHWGANPWLESMPEEGVTERDGQVIVETHVLHELAGFWHHVEAVYFSDDPPEDRTQPEMDSESTAQNPASHSEDQCRAIEDWEPADASIDFEDQESDGRSVIVDSAHLSDGGFVAIYDWDAFDNTVAPDEVVGVSEYLEPGSHEDIEIELDELPDDQFLGAVPHHDFDDDQTFDFTTADTSEWPSYITREDGPYLETRSGGTDTPSMVVPIGDTAEILVEEDELDGEIDSCTVIDEPGEYELTADIEPDDLDTDACIAIQASDVTLEGNGHVVSGVDAAGDDSAGVQVFDPDRDGDDVENVTVRNLRVEDWGTGVDIGEGSPVGPPRPAEIHLEDVAAVDNDGRGISVTEAHGSTFENVTAERNGEGISLYLTSDATFEEITVSENNVHGLFLMEDVGNNEFTDVTATDNAGNAIRMNMHVTENVFSDLYVANNDDGIGIQDVNVTDTTIRDATIENNGISAVGGEHELQDVTIRNDDGPELSGAGSVTADELRIGDEAVFTFVEEGLVLDAVDRTELPVRPEDAQAVGGGVEVRRIDDGVDVRFEYDEADAGDQLAVWRYDGDEWTTAAEVDAETEGTIDATLTEDGVYAPVEPTEDVSDGEINSCTVIDEPGEYEIVSDLNAAGDCLQIEAEVTIDGNGHTLEGDGTGRGIVVSEETPPITLQDVTIRNFETGVQTPSSPGGTDFILESVTIEENTGNGIDLQVYDELTCNGCTIRQNGGTAIDGLERNQIAVTNCDIRENSGDAIDSGVSTPVSVVDCEIIGNGGPVYLSPLDSETQSTVENTEIRNSADTGIASIDSDAPQMSEPVSIRNCVISDNGGPGIQHENSFFEVQNCTITGNEVGYELRDVGQRIQARLRHNVIEANTGSGARVVNPERLDGPVDAECNYWGHPSGPEHEENPRENPQGQPVSDHVEFIPWSVQETQGGDGQCVGGLVEFVVSELDPVDVRVAPGETVDVSVTVENVEEAAGSQTIELRIDDTVEAEQELELEANESTTVGFENVPTDHLEPGEYELGVFTEDDDVTGMLTVEEEAEPGEFEVSGLDPSETTVTQGDILEISATVENVGGEETTQTIELRVEGDVLDEERLTLDGGEAETITFFDVDTGGLEPGDHAFGVFSEDDEATGTVTVEDEPPEFRIQSLEPQNPVVTEGETFDVRVTVENVGGPDDGTVTLEAGPTDRTEPVNLAAGEETTVEFTNVNTDGLGTGDHPLTVSIADEVETGTLTIEPAEEEEGPDDPDEPDEDDDPDEPEDDGPPEDEEEPPEDEEDPPEQEEDDPPQEDEAEEENGDQPQQEEDEDEEDEENEG